MSKIPIALSWSGGKDCSYALHLLQQGCMYEVKYLLCTCNTHTKEINMHHVHESLLAAQAVAIGIPLKICYVNSMHNAAYETAVKNMAIALQAEGIHHIAFGDIFLKDLRQYREDLLQPLGMHCVFPLWQQATASLLQQIIAAGCKSIICCIDAQKMPQHWLGKILDATSVTSLPASIDPCGENGEYHSFCFDGPMFHHPLQVSSTSTSSQSMALNATDVAIFSWAHLQLLPQV